MLALSAMLIIPLLTACNPDFGVGSNPPPALVGDRSYALIVSASYTETNKALKMPVVIDESYVRSPGGAPKKNHEYIVPEFRGDIVTPWIRTFSIAKDWTDKVFAHVSAHASVPQGVSLKCVIVDMYERPVVGNQHNSNVVNKGNLTVDCTATL